MIHRFCSTAVAICVVFWAAQAGAQQPDPPDEDDTVDLFGFGLPQTERLKISGELIAGWSHDGVQAQLGFEKQARVAQATITFSGRVTDRVRYLVSFNPVNEVAAKPACGEANFFFPNDPTIYPAAVRSCPAIRRRAQARGHLQHLRARLHQPAGTAARRLRRLARRPQRVGQVRPLHRADRVCSAEVGSWTAKDLTRIQRLNAEANFGLMLAFAAGAAAPEDASAPPAPPLVRGGGDGRARRRQSRKGLRLVLFR